MTRVKLSTTVNERLLREARLIRRELDDDALIDEALSVLVEAHRRAQLDAAYAAYDRAPLADRDEWGDLASFGDAASSF